MPARIFYIDPTNGIDSGGIATETPLGWWSIAFDSGSGAAPTADIVCTNNGQTAQLTVVVVTTGSWAGNNAGGYLYFYGKSGAWASGAVAWGTGATAGTANINSDLVYNPWKTISNGSTSARVTSGDTCRILMSPAPVAIGTGVWTGTARATGAFPATTAITATANNGAGLIRVTSTAHGMVTGDVVQILAVTGTTEANGNWRVTRFDDNNIDLVGSAYVNAWVSGGTCQKITTKTVKNDTVNTKLIDDMHIKWTLANTATVTAVTPANSKGGHGASRINKTSPANSTLYAYNPISPGSLAAYQKITFWMLNGTSTNANQWSICLCSNADGTGVLFTFKIPVIQSTTRWTPQTLASVEGGNLSGTVLSIALYSGTSAASTTGLTFDSIHACSTDGLNYQSLISSNSSNLPDGQGGTEGYYGIQNISNDSLNYVLDTEPNTLAGAGRGYSGAGANATLYRRETHKTTYMSSSSTGVATPPVSQVDYQGGYNSTTNAQTGETYFDGGNGYGYGLNATSFNTFNWLNFYRYYWGIYSNVNSALQIFTNIQNVSNNSHTGLSWSCWTGTVANIANANNNGTNGIYLGNGYYDFQFTTIGSCSNNGSYGISTASPYHWSIGTIANVDNNGVTGFNSTTLGGAITSIGSASYNGTTGIDLTTCYALNIGTVTNCNYNNIGINFGASSFGNRIGIVTNDNYNANYAMAVVTGAINNYIGTINTTGSGSYAINSNGGVTFIRNWTYAEGSPVFTNNMPNEQESRLYLYKLSGSVSNNWVYSNYVQFYEQTTTRHTASGSAWRLYLTNASRNIREPFIEKIASVAVTANNLVTIKVYAQKTHASNIIGGIMFYGGAVAGTPSVNTYALCPTDVNWNQLTLTFTPSETGVFDVYAYAYMVSGAHSIYYDDIEVTQVGGQPDLRGMDYSEFGAPFVTQYNSGSNYPWA